MPPDPPEFDDWPTRPRDEVLAYAYRRGRLRRRLRRLALAGPAIVGVAVLISIAAASTTRPRPVRVASKPPVTTVAPTVATTSAGSGTVLPVSPSTTIPSVRTTVPPTSVTQPAISGRVTDPDGKPVAGAYVIGLDSLAVVRTDNSGRFSMPMPCRPERLVAATWLLPISTPGPHPNGIATGRDTTNYGPPPTTPGLGYSFTGQASDAQHAAVASCDRTPVTIVLQPGGNVDIRILDAAGTAVTSGVPDNLYLPGLGDQAALETAPLDQRGHQLVDQLAGGTLRIHGTTSNLRCSGQGVATDPAVAGATVTVVPGSTVQVTCQES